MENHQERGKGVPVWIKAIRLFSKADQSGQAPLETVPSPQAQEPKGPALDQQLGEYLNQRTEHFTAMQKKSLVLAVLLLMASSFVYLFSRGLSPSRKTQVEQSLPALPSDTVSSESKLRVSP